MTQNTITLNGWMWDEFVGQFGGYFRAFAPGFTEHVFQLTENKTGRWATANVRNSDGATFYSTEHETQNDAFYVVDA